MWRSYRLCASASVVLARVAEAAVGLALQRGQVEQQRRGLRGRLAFLGDAGRLAAHGVGDGLRLALVPDAVGACCSASSGGSFFQFGSNHLPGYSPASARKAAVDFPVVAADELADLLLALDHHGQRRRLHPADGGQEEAAVARIERGHGARAVDADQPVGLGARARGVGQALHLLVAAQLRRSRRGSPAASSTAATAA